jgi:hypothetical protein
LPHSSRSFCLLPVSCANTPWRDKVLRSPFSSFYYLLQLCVFLTNQNLLCSWTFFTIHFLYCSSFFANVGYNFFSIFLNFCRSVFSKPIQTGFIWFFNQSFLLTRLYGIQFFSFKHDKIILWRKIWIISKMTCSLLICFVIDFYGLLWQWGATMSFFCLKDRMCSS